MTQKQWHEEIEDEINRQADRAAAISKSVLRVIPFSVLLGAAVIITVISVWGLKEFSRMLLQVLLTLTIGATVLAGWIRRIDRVVEESDEKP